MKDLLTTIEQIKPDYLSFAFPEGLLKEGYFKFDRLNDNGENRFQIPLVNPTTLGYGYCIRFFRLEYVVDGAVHTVIVNEYKQGNCVFIESDGERNRIADDFVAFLDCGTPIPLWGANGDISLLSEDVTAGNVNPEKTAPYFDSFNGFFEDIDGKEVSLGSGDLKVWQGHAHDRMRVLTKAAVNADAPNMKLYAPVLGLNFLGRYDFQFNFENGTPSEVVFVKRKE